MIETIVEEVWTPSHVRQQSFGVLKNGVQARFCNYLEGRFLKLSARRGEETVATFLGERDLIGSSRDIVSLVDRKVYGLCLIGASPWLAEDTPFNGPA